MQIGLESFGDDVERESGTLEKGLQGSEGRVMGNGVAPLPRCSVAPLVAPGHLLIPSSSGMYARKLKHSRLAYAGVQLDLRFTL